MKGYTKPLLRPFASGALAKVFLSYLIGGIMKTLFGRHRVRSTFYHVIAAIVVVSTITQLLGLMSVTVCLVITTVLFFVDYLAEMYDPCPVSPGPWFVRHFHRFLDGEEG